MAWIDNVEVSESLGSVTGTIISITLQAPDHYWITIQDELWNNFVECYVMSDIAFPVPDVNNIGKRVVVSGMLSRNIKTGKPMRIDDVVKIELFPHSAIDSYKAARGCLPWKVGDETGEESIRRIRDME